MTTAGALPAPAAPGSHAAPSTPAPRTAAGTYPAALAAAAASPSPRITAGADPAPAALVPTPPTSRTEGAKQQEPSSVTDQPPRARQASKRRLAEAFSLVLVPPPMLTPSGRPELLLPCGARGARLPRVAPTRNRASGHLQGERTTGRQICRSSLNNGPVPSGTDWRVGAPTFSHTLRECCSLTNPLSVLSKPAYFMPLTHTL